MMIWKLVWRMLSRHASRPGLVLAVAMLPVMVAAAPATAAPTGQGPLGVTVRDFKVQSARRTVRAGTVVLRVHNVGPSTHEINVDRTSLADSALPLKPDGLTVQEDSPQLQRIDSIEQLDLGATSEVTVKLKPGHYVFYCNLEGHYLGGMHVSVNVVGPGGS